MPAGVDPYVYLGSAWFASPPGPLSRGDVGIGGGAFRQLHERYRVSSDGVSRVVAEHAACVRLIEQDARDAACFGPVHGARGQGTPVPLQSEPGGTAGAPEHTTNLCAAQAREVVEQSRLQ